MKSCFKCKEIKDDSQFNRGKSERGLSSYCKSCTKLISDQYYRDNSDRLNKRSLDRYKLKVRVSDPTLPTKLNKILYSARQRRKDVEISYDDLLSIWENQKGLCNYSGLPLVLEANLPNTVSLDRIDSKMGYVKGNVHLVCTMVNRMKQEYGEELFLSMCRTITEHSKAKTTSENNPRLDNDNIVITEPLTLNSVSTIPNLTKQF